MARFLIFVLLAAALPCSADLKVLPEQAVLHGAREQIQLIARNQSKQDVTRDVDWESANPDIAIVDKTGAVRPAGNGTATITATLNNETTTVQVEVRNMGVTRPVSFDHETLPILSKSGCSGGSCHGAPHGKAGFRLSLFGGDPVFDRAALVREARGRRVSPLNAANSLLLKKPTMEVPHMGGRRFTTEDQTYRILHDWIAEGCRVDRPENACTGITVFPSGNQLVRFPHAQTQFRVVARFADGAEKDVTHLAKFESSDPSVMSVSRNGFAEGESRGDVAIIVRYLEYFQTPLITCVRDVDDYYWKPVAAVNYVDRNVHQKLQQMQFQQSDLCSDEVFLRRVYLDVIGVLPTPEERSRFLEEQRDDKRAALIEALLKRPEYARFWAQKWGDLLRISRRQIGLTSVFKYSAWLRAAVAENRPYDVMARQLLTAGGSTIRNPAGNFYRTSADTNDAMETSAQLFLGTRIQCAKCHNHPFERWTQSNYYGLAAVFHRVGRKKTVNKEEAVIFASTSGEVTHPATGQTAAPWVPASGLLDVQDGQDRRVAFADWLTSPRNPWFARVEVNRIWAQVMGVGIVEPFDDFRDSNPPSNPALLDALAADFRASGYDRNHILRTILNSRTYQSASANRFNRSDSRYFSHYRPRRLSAEQLVDALSEVTGLPESFTAVPAGTKATWLPAPDLKPHNRAELGSVDFLKVFGQPERQSVCECERGDETSLGQALQLLNGKFLHDRLSSDRSRFRQLHKQGTEPAEILRDLYVRAISREPTPEEMKAAISYFATAEDKHTALEDICWVIVNKDEFLFQH